MKKKINARARRRRPNKGGTGVSHGGRPLSLQMVPNMRAQKKNARIVLDKPSMDTKIFQLPDDVTWRSPGPLVISSS